MNKLTKLQKHIPIEERSHNDKPYYFTTNTRLFKASTNLAALRPKIKNKSTFVSMMNPKNRSRKMNNRTMGDRADPKEYFRAISRYPATGIDDFLMQEFFHTPYVPTQVSVVGTPKKEESLEIVKMGTTINYSKVLQSYVSSTHKSMEQQSQTNLIKPLDLSSVQNGESRLLGFKSQMQKLTQELVKLEIGSSHTSSIKEHLRQINDIAETAMREKNKPKISMTFANHLKENLFATRVNN